MVGLETFVMRAVDRIELPSTSAATTAARFAVVSLFMLISVDLGAIIEKQKNLTRLGPSLYLLGRGRRPFVFSGPRRRRVGQCVGATFCCHHFHRSYLLIRDS